MNSSELLASVKRGISVPANQTRFTDADILAIADEEIQTKLLPVLLSLRQEYLVKNSSITLVANQSAYSVPYRAIGRTLRSLATTQNNQKSFLQYIDPSDVEYTGTTNTGTPSSFYFEGDSFILVPTPNAATTLEVKYEIQCNNLAIVSDCGLISAINTVGNYVTLTSVPTSLVTGATVDFIQGKAGNTLIDIDKAITNVSGTNIYFTSLPSTLVVGDWLAIAQTSPVVQLPREMHQVLAQAVECRLLEALGDFEGMGASSQKLSEKTNAMLSLLAPRQKGSQQKIVQFNGLLNRARSRFNA